MRVNDCGSGVVPHADAGYELAIETAKKQGLKLPLVRGRGDAPAPAWVGLRPKF